MASTGGSSEEVKRLKNCRFNLYPGKSETKNVRFNYYK